MSSQKHGHPLKITATFLNETSQAVLVAWLSNATNDIHRGDTGR